MADSKACTVCKIDKNASEFHVSSAGRLGRHSICKICMSIRGKLSRELFREEEKKPEYSESAAAELFWLFNKIKRECAIDS